MDHSVPENDHRTFDPRCLEHPLRERFEVAVSLIGFSDLGDWWNIPDLTAPYWRLYVNAAPGAAIGFRGAWIPLEPGVLYLIPAWVGFAARCTRSGLGHVYATVDVRGLSGPLVRAVFPRPLVLREARSEAREFARLGLAAVRRGSVSLVDQLRIRAIAQTAVAMAVEGLGEQDRAALSAQWSHGPLATVLTYLQTNPMAPASNRDLARIAGCTPDHLVRLFRRELGQTPARHVLELRLTAAAQVLAQEDLGIDAIAEDFGFANRHSFTRAFTRHLGCGPGEWRRRQR